MKSFFTLSAANQAPSSNRTGVIQPLPGIGDMVWFLPALQAIAASSPDGKITLLAKKSSLAAQLLAAESYIDQIIFLPSGRGLSGLARNWVGTWQALRQAGLARVFVLHQSPRYRFLARLAGVRDVVAYPPDLARSKEKAWQKSLSFLERLSIPIPGRYARLSLSVEKMEVVRRDFSASPEPWFVLAPGASEPARRWPPDRFAACADAIIEQQGGTVFLTGAPREQACILQVHNLCRYKDKVVPAVGIEFTKFMGLIACSKFLLGNDSGPANVAAALGIPAFALCGTSTPPLHSPHLHLIMPDVPPEQARGMDAISVEGVLRFIRDKI